jgi:hypothetical protein
VLGGVHGEDGVARETFDVLDAAPGGGEHHVGVVLVLDLGLGQCISLAVGTELVRRECTCGFHCAEYQWGAVK